MQCLKQMFNNIQMTCIATFYRACTLAYRKPMFIVLCQTKPKNDVYRHKVNIMLNNYESG